MFKIKINKQDHNIKLFRAQKNMKNRIIKIINHELIFQVEENVLH